ncbi:hypothetical protein HMPREF9333_02241 [Johnsonella ignava ATCC 51276]|jgi:hypothetical protein|uniref:PSP1 C-terminal domain-containing protein n=1 Tax=Johnsonella ignava ATCC 51276 TaxID=679200 RepID=G5GKZ6_9FIRM|nr:stage 0 sporulation family protein [Johnsonella ignava]EHI54599.1 hypothetical protein HMPREF9333_02241 [Johnsonella ignava ATCC 51276]
MTKVIGVRFREVGKVYYFSPGNFELCSGKMVIVETSRGLECGTVVMGNREVDEKDIVLPLKSVKRLANEEDRKKLEKNRNKEKEAFRVCKERVAAHNLDMKLISVEYSFDDSKVLFYFTAQDRIDFRELVKDLAAIFKLRIELRQIGVREKAKMVGGIGSCGRPICCHAYLSDMVHVSIKMAKEQNLSLNPQKISGVCGRLMCCLKNESDTYEYLNRRIPKEGSVVETNRGIGVVASVNVLRQKVKVIVDKSDDEKEIVEFDVADIKSPALRNEGSREINDNDCVGAKDGK